MRNIFKKTKQSNSSLPQWIQNIQGMSLLPLTKEYLNDIYSKYETLFSQKVSEQIILENQDQTCAIIANDCYLPPEKRNTTIGNYKLVQEINKQMLCVYQDPTNKICILGLRGTVITNLKDIASDAQIVLDINGIDPRIQEALHTYDTIKREFPGYQISVCGHSLGGTLAYVVAKHRAPHRCVVFNPGIAFNTFFFQMLEDTLKDTERTQQTYTYKILGDIISTIAFVGHTKIFRIKSRDPLALHAMENFVGLDTTKQ